jgi:anti-anti-sigma factor
LTVEVATFAFVEVGDVFATVEAVGEFDLATVHILTDALETACESGRNVKLDLGGVGFIDATTLGVIVRAHNLLVASGLGVEIVNPTAFLLRLLRLTGLEWLTSSDQYPSGLTP